jgi:hypothetical protein
MHREDTYSVRVSVDDVDLGIWDKKQGGAVDSDETTYRPGGMAEQISLGGPRTTENLTVSKLNDEVTHGRVHWLTGRVGRGTGVITQQPLDADGKAWGRPLVWRGKLKRVTPPDSDSNGNAAALIELEFTVDGGVN